MYQLNFVAFCFKCIALLSNRKVLKATNFNAWMMFPSGFLTAMPSNQGRFYAISSQSGLSRRLSGTESTASAGDVGLIPGSRTSSELEMATYSTILAQETPWIEKPGGLQFMGSQKSQAQLGNYNTQQQIVGQLF